MGRPPLPRASAEGRRRPPRDGPRRQRPPRRDAHPPHAARRAEPRLRGGPRGGDGRRAGRRAARDRRPRPPAEARRHGHPAETDSFPPAADALAAAVEQVASGDWRGLAPLFAATDRALPPLRAAYAQAAGDRRTNLAIALGLLGDGTGEAALADALEAADFSRGWDYDGVTDKGYKGGPADRALWALGACRGERAVAALAAAAPKIAAHPFYSHFRAYAMAAESIGDKRLAAPLAALLAAPGVRGHASRELAPLPYERKGSRLANKIVGDILRELALARAILVVADGDETAPGAAEAKQTLEEYAADARGVFAAYARKVLQRVKEASDTAGTSA